MTFKAPETSIKNIVGSFRIVDIKTLCATKYGPKNRTGVKVEEEEALDEDGKVLPKYEELRDPVTQAPTGEYVRRADEAVYPHAEEVLKDANKRIGEIIGEVVFALAGGTPILPSSNYERWDGVKERIAEIVLEANDQLEEMRTVPDDPSSPKINEVLRSKGMDAMEIAFEPLLHPEIVATDESMSDDQAKQAGAVAKTAARRLSEVAEAARECDPAAIVESLAGLGAIDALFSDEAARQSVRVLLQIATATKDAAEVERRKMKAAEAARTRANSRGPSDPARERDLAAAIRHETEAAGRSRELLELRTQLEEQAAIVSRFLPM
jgi:hypothetical protein